MIGYIVLNFLIMVFIVYFSVSIILDPSNFSGNQFKGRINSFCQKDPNGFDKLLCKNEIKKKKFLWIFIDGLAYDQLHFLELKKKNKQIALFNVFSDSYRQSGALHETILTGKFSRNFIAKKISIDHLMKQIKKSGSSIKYVGINFPLVYLNGETKIFDRIFIKSPDYYPFSSLCDQFPTFNDHVGPYNEYENEIYDDKTRFKVIKGIESYYDFTAKIEDINICLKNNDVYYSKDNSSNLVFYSQYIDHLNHAFYKYFPKTIATTMKYEEGILSFMKWVDHNPDYVLLVNSDHGGQNFRGEDNFCNHGCIDHETYTNGAMFMIYYKDMQFNDENLQFVRHEDVAPTIAQVIEDINIPLESTGFPLKFHNNSILNLVQVRSKEVQLINLIESFIEVYPSKMDKANALLDRIRENVHYKIINSLYINNNTEALNNETLYKNYKEFVVESEKYFHKFIFEKSGSKMLLFTMLLIFLKFIFLIKKSYKDSNLKFIENSMKRLIFTIILYTILNLDYIFLIFFKENVEFTFGFQYICFCILLMLFIILYFIWNKKLYNYSNIEHIEGKQKFYVFFIVSIIVILLFIGNNTYLKLKTFFAAHHEIKYYDIITYITLYGYCIFAIKDIKHSYYILFSKIRIRQDIKNIILQTILFILLIYYDTLVYFRNYTVSQDIQTQWIALTIYLLILSYTIFFLFNLKTEDNINKFKFNSTRLIKVVIFPLLFFISDTLERIFLVAIILPIYHFLSKFLREYKRRDPLLKFFLMICIVRVGDLIFYLSKGTYTFDVSLESANKTITWHPDLTPILSGFFFGIHKAKIYIICTLVVLDSLQFKKYDLNDIGSLFINILDIKATLSIVFFFFYLYYDIQTLYLSSFMMFLTKSISLLLLILYILKAALFTFIFDSIRKLFKSNILMNEFTTLGTNYPTIEMK